MKISIINTGKSSLFVLSMVFILTIVSCNEDFVTKEFDNGVVSDNFFQNATDAEQALTAVYDVIALRGMYREGVWVLGDAPSDDINELTIPEGTTRK